jgi:hypothetical protein
VYRQLTQAKENITIDELVTKLSHLQVMSDMSGSQKIKLASIFLFLILLASCAQVEPTPMESFTSALPPDAPTPVVVRILNLDLSQAASPTAPIPSPTPLPTLAPPPTPDHATAVSESESPAAPTCTNKVEFVKNLSVSDNTAFKPSQPFAKIWQVRNIGTCVWTTDYLLVYASGESMGSPPSVSLTQVVNPGETVDLRLNLIAPEAPKTYTGGWFLQDAAGTTFGLGPDSIQPLGLTIVVRPLPKPPI